MRNNEFDYMKGIYAFIEEANDEVVTEDDVVFIGDDEDDFIPFSEDSYDEDDVIFIDDEEEDEYYLGDDCIPLPEFEQVEEQVVVIDENYELDEYETDEFEGTSNDGDDVIFIDDDYEEIMAMTENLEGAESFYDIVDEAESNIKTLDKEEIEEIDGISSVDAVDDKLSKDIARDVIEEASTNSEILLDELGEESEEGSWINEDIFGNDIESIIAEKADVEEEEVYEEGSFEDWVNGNSK